MNPDKIRNVLNILFLILALAAIIVILCSKGRLQDCLCTFAAQLYSSKLMEFFIRFTNR